MKISINQLRYYQNMYSWSAEPAPDGIDKLVQLIGAQLAGVEEVVSFGLKYQGIVIAKVVECWKHSNSDHLSVCMIDDGGVVDGVDRNEQGYVQVVCGASNVRAGLTVAWLPPGSTVPSSYDQDPFVLSVRDIRGEISHGMLASPKELALGDSHEGILEIDEMVAPGTLFTEHYNLSGDSVIDMENKMFTHRPDCFGLIGLAREIAGIQGQKFTSPDWYRSDGVNVAADAPEAEPKLSVIVRNEIPELVPRFVVVPMSDITIKSSPVWLQVELSRMGLRPINNLVDLTNYYMLLTGQPLHAYDYDKVAAQTSHSVASSDSQNTGSPLSHATLVIRQAVPEESLLLLNGKQITPRPGAIVIASGVQAIGLGGVMGGSDTEVCDTTTRIILESASFDMYSIRRTAMAHGLFSEAVTRFNKGQSPLQNMAVLARIVQDISEICGGRVAGMVVDDNHLSAEVRARNSLFPEIVIEAAFVNQRLGLQLLAADMATLLINVEFDVSVAAATLTIRAPFWRTDIEIAEDVVEEIGRLYGYDKLPDILPLRSTLAAVKNRQFELQAEFRCTLSRAGANEVLSYSFVHGKLFAAAGQDVQYAYKLSNALSPDLQYYRLSLTPSLLEKIHPNIKTGHREMALFEIGKAHSITEVDDDGLPLEFDRLALVFSAESKTAATQYQGAAYFQAKKYASVLLNGLETTYTFLPLPDANFDNHVLLGQMVAPYDPARSAVIKDGDRIIGVVGEYKLGVQTALKLPPYTAGFELYISALQDKKVTPYQTLSRYPALSQDICLRVSADLPYQTLHDFIDQLLQAQSSASKRLTLSPIDIYVRDDEAGFKQFTFRIETVCFDKTLTDGEVTKLLDTVAQACADEFQAIKI